MDLFLLTIVGPFIFLLAGTGEYAWEAPVMTQVEHVRWAGFCLWDIIMPLFMFMSGVTIPFSLEKYRTPGQSRSKVYLRIARRFVLLWILGMVAQGQLLDLNWNVLRFFSNTLQAIAVGYLVSALMFLNTKPRVQLITAAGLLLLYWVLMMTVGGGNFEEHGNLCEIVDNAVLGKHRDHASVAADGSIQVNPVYTYTWIVSSINFIVTVMSGMFAGEVLKDSRRTEKNKLAVLFIGGAAMVAAGWLWHLQMPVIKHIWTSSMVLVSSGYCFLLLGTVYYIVDYKKKGRALAWFKIWGMNSILAYMMHEIPLFNSIPESLLHGLEQYLSPEWYWFVIGMGCLVIQWAVLKICYDRKIYLKV